MEGKKFHLFHYKYQGMNAYLRKWEGDNEKQISII